MFCVKTTAFVAIADTEDIQVALGLAGSHFKDACKLIGVLFGHGSLCCGLEISDPRVVKAATGKWPIAR